MNLQGDFEGAFLTSILQLLCEDQNTGILQVICGKKKCKVFFQNGTIVYAQSSQKSVRLGALLKRDGVISNKQLQECLMSTKTGKKFLGKMLVDKNYISKTTLLEYNKQQAEEILYSILFWNKGEFKYKDALLKFEGMVITNLNPMKLILEASRRIDEMSILTERITSDQLIYKLTHNKDTKQSSLKCSADERQILTYINERRTVRDIITISNFDEFMAYKTLYSLLSSGLIKPSKTKKKEKTGLELDFILSVYGDLVKITLSALSSGSGEKNTILLQRAKKNLPSAQGQLLHNFQIGIPAHLNHEAIIKACKQAGGDKSRQRLLLIDSFNGLCHQLINQTISQIDENMIYEMIQEIDQMLEYVKTSQQNSLEKDKMVNDMKNVLEDTIKQVRRHNRSTDKNSGLFSFFKKKPKM